MVARISPSMAGSAVLTLPTSTLIAPPDSCALLAAWRAATHLLSAVLCWPAHLQEEQRELANTIRVSGSILLSTVSNFLDFFKLEAVRTSGLSFCVEGTALAHSIPLEGLLWVV